ncbi:YybH family protein [Streptomyces cellulosae]|uniref:YybH family protein n=1 Tax=Streptomyces cellulosae TaxID=1968 RepID=A0ABW7YIA6_STRCE
MATSISSPDLAKAAEEHGKRYVAAFNSGDLDAINAMYADDAVSVWEPGNPLVGEARKAALAEFIAQKPKMTATLRESHVTSTTALLVVDWAIDIPTPEGGTEHVEGVGLDVLRRGTDGEWRFAIDNPFGETR